MLDRRTVARAFRIAVWRSLTRCCPPAEPAWRTALSFFSRMSRTTASRWFAERDALTLASVVVPVGLVLGALAPANAERDSTVEAYAGHALERGR